MILALAILLAPIAPVLADDEAQAFYDAEATPRIVKILELGMRPGASMYVDLEPGTRPVS